jgi:predicted RNase H-like HicB family nuclease
MQFHIFIQNPAANCFRASVMGMPETWVVEGETKVEALDRVKVLLEECLATGEFVTINIPSIHDGDKSENGQIRILHSRKGDFSNLPGCGIFKDDPTFEDFVEKMSELRSRSQD